MKQSELEQFVEQLAKAEQAAAETIRQAERTVEENLEKRRQQLGQTHQHCLKKIDQDFESDKQKLLQGIVDHQQLLEQQCATEIESIQRRHQAVRPQLVAWLVERVVQR